ncbi:MAG: gamma-glutamyltransferase [Acidobacteriota bacterium]
MINQPRFRATLVFSLFLSLVAWVLAYGIGPQTSARFGNLQTFKQEVIAERGVVASNQVLASAAGQQILMKGGNAVDALIATFFALSVVQPSGMSPFGSGFINIQTAKGESITLDNYTVAPAAAKPDMYRLVHPEDEEKQAEAGHVTVDRENTVGFRSIGVPGGMKAWLWALKNHGSGSITLREILQPSIDYARHGFTASPGYAAAITGSRERNARFAGWVEEFMPGGKTPQSGARVYRPGYAVTLEALADAAPPGTGFAGQLEAAGRRFYKGDIASNIVGYIRENGGILTMEDMSYYYGAGLDDLSESQGLRLRKPVRGSYRGYDIIAMPPTSSGGTHIVEILNILEGYDIRAMGFDNPETMHLMAEAMKIAWADRDAYMGDPDYAHRDPSYNYPPPPVESLISKEYAERRRREIRRDRAGRYAPGRFAGGAGDLKGRWLHESLETTHATAMDSDGNVIAMTQTIHQGFGSGVVLPGRVPGSGLCINDTMELFDPDPRPGFERANAIAPRKRMLSSMSPTIILKDGRPFMAIGTPGGTRIYSAVLQGIINVIDHGMNIQQAVEAPRIWTMMYGDVEVEQGFPDDAVAALESMGHGIRRVRTVAGGMNGVLLDPVSGLIHGGSCWRNDGAAAGWSGGNALDRSLPYPRTWDGARK